MEHRLCKSPQMVSASNTLPNATFAFCSAVKLALDALDRADADVMFCGELANAGAAPLQRIPDFAFGHRRTRWAAKTFALSASALVEQRDVRGQPSNAPTI